MYLLFDIGGTRIKIASSTDGKTLDNIKSFDTPKDFEEGISLIKRTAEEIAKENKIDFASGGVRFLDQTKNKILEHPHINLWPNKPLKEGLEQVLGTKVSLENDCIMAGLGEAVFGAGKGQEIVAYLSISTGVGGARIVNGKIDKNSLGFEPGFQIIEEGYLEDFISGYGLEKRFSKKAEKLTDPNIWDEVCQYLAIGLNNTIVHWSPDVVIIGGSVAKSIDLGKVNTYLASALKVFSKKPPLIKASLEDHSVLYGALAYLASKLTPPSTLHLRI